MGIYFGYVSGRIFRVHVCISFRSHAVGRSLGYVSGQIFRVREWADLYGARLCVSSRRGAHFRILGFGVVGFRVLWFRAWV